LINEHFYAEISERLTINWSKPDNLQCIGKLGVDADSERSEGLELRRGESAGIEQPLTCVAVTGTGDL